MISKIIKEAKKGKAINLYKESERKDLMENELKELKILESYMPDQIPEEELENKINDCVRNYLVIPNQNLVY